MRVAERGGRCYGAPWAPTTCMLRGLALKDHGRDPTLKGHDGGRDTLSIGGRDGPQGCYGELPSNGRAGGTAVGAGTRARVSVPGRRAR